MSQQVTLGIVNPVFGSVVEESVGLAQNEYFDIPCPPTPTNYIEGAP